MHSDERPEGLGEIDQRMDAALRSYAEPGEIPEARVVLARVLAQADADGAGRRRLWWWVGAVTAACLLAALLVGGEWGLRRPRVPEIAWVPRAPGVANSGRGGLAQSHAAGAKSGPERAGAPLAQVGRVRATEPMPKLDVFPSPRPLSPEEQALVAFALRAPSEAKKAVVEDQQHWDDPIIVADLRKLVLQSGNQQDH